jgi:hypothetical protein
LRADNLRRSKLGPSHDFARQSLRRRSSRVSIGGLSTNRQFTLRKLKT